MSLFGGMGGFFDEDPFFGGHMRQMFDQFHMAAGFGGLRPTGGNALMPFGFPNMTNIMDSFKMGLDDPNCHSFSSSTVMMTTNGPDGRPQVYQSSQSTRCAPGGVKETKKAVCDSRTGTKRLAIGHHIGERGHVRERIQDIHSGDQEESEDFINIEEDEADVFNREWAQRARSLTTGHSAIGYPGAERSDMRRHRQLPAITSSSSSEEPEIIAERPRKRARATEATKSAPGKKTTKPRTTHD